MAVEQSQFEQFTPTRTLNLKNIGIDKNTKLEKLG
jgi:hypothetical protein